MPRALRALVTRYASPFVAALTLSGCESLTDVLTDTTLIPGDFGSAGNVGAQNGNDWPSGWSFAFDHGTRFDEVCIDEGRCGVGGVTAAFGSLTEPNPQGHVVYDSTCVTCFGWVGTPDISLPASGSGVTTVQSSGMESLDLTVQEESDGWELRFDYAFLTTSSTSDPAANYATVSILTGPRGANATTLEILRVDRVNTTLGTSANTPTALHSGGCGSTQGTGRLGNVVHSSYPVCTGWKLATMRIDAVVGVPFRIRLMALEEQNASPVALLFDNMVLSRISRR